MILLVIMLTLSMLPMTANDTKAAETTPIFASLEGPAVVATGEKWQYTVTIIGGPAETSNGNYSYTVTMKGLDTTSALLIPGNGGPSKSETFFFNFTAPSLAQEVTLILNATSANLTKSLHTNVQYKVTVVSPIVVKANIVNSGNVAVNAIPLSVQLYEDGLWRELSNRTVSIGSGATYSYVYNWTALGISPGEYRIRLVIDPNNDLVTFENGGAVFEKTIYYEAAGYGNINALLWVLVILLGFLAYVLYRRPTGKRKK